MCVNISRYTYTSTALGAKGGFYTKHVSRSKDEQCVYVCVCVLKIAGFTIDLLRIVL